MIRIGIISPSEIAFKRFIPAIKKLPAFQFMGIATANITEWYSESKNQDKIKVEGIIKQEREKAAIFVEKFGCKIYDSYMKMITSNEIDAIYLPLPPALHYKWAKLAIKERKHVLIEKPSTTKLEDTESLISLAIENNVAMHENYMFVFHQQLNSVNDILQSGKIGAVRIFKISFGFPRRAANDFRYNKKLGGGALLDCGGYTLKYASILLGETAQITSAHLNYIDEYNVDIFGSATLVNEKGITAQVSFGMDNSYKCDLEVWGSKGYLTSERVLTAPDGYVPKATIIKEDKTEIINLPPDDAFKKSISHFQKCISDKELRKSNFQEIIKQSQLIAAFQNKLITS